MNKLYKSDVVFSHPIGSIRLSKTGEVIRADCHKIGVSLDIDTDNYDNAKKQAIEFFNSIT